MLIVVRKSVGSHGHAHQHAERIVFVTDRHGQQRRRCDRFGKLGKEMLFSLTSERYDNGTAATDDGTERGLVHGDARGELAAAQVAVEVLEQQDVVDNLVIGTGANTQ